MNTILCPNCKKSIELSEALTGQLTEEISSALKKEHQEHLETVKKEAAQTAVKKISEENQLRTKDLENENKEAKERNKALQEQLLELSKMLRDLKTKDEEREVVMQKTLREEEKKIKEDATKKAQEEQHLNILELQKKISDVEKTNEELTRKLHQGSQQTQGEVFEQEFEEILRREFPNDQILEVAKGVRGGDIIQEVWDRNGNQCGKILWELKNTKTWSEQWIEKLKIDQRSITADWAVIISEVVPSSIESAKYYKNVWITKRDFVIGLASALRMNLIQLHMAKKAAEGKKDKMEILYTYLSGTEFKHRVEAIVEAFSSMQEEIEKEKRYFTNKWARDEKNIRMVIDNTIGMHGDLKGIIGAALPGISGIDLQLEGGEPNGTTIADGISKTKPLL